MKTRPGLKVVDSGWREGGADALYPAEEVKLEGDKDEESGVVERRKKR